MTYLDPGELTPEQMYDRTPIKLPARVPHETVDLDLMESDNFGDETVAAPELREAA